MSARHEHFAPGPRPRLDLVESARDYRLFVDLADTRAEDIALEVKRGVFSLRARVAALHELGSRERRLDPAAVEWRVQLDFGTLLSGDELSAVYEQGVLLVVLPKHVAPEPGAPSGEVAGGT